MSDKGPQAWLSALLQGQTSIDMPADLSDFMNLAIAYHLDPYLDGEVTSPEEERGTQPLLVEIQTSYQQTYGRQLPSPPEVVLALYICYAVSKANAVHCFTDLIMGQGRLPLSAAEQEAHVKGLAKALPAAVERDFGKGHNAIQGVVVSEALIDALAREQVGGALLH